MMVYKKGSQVIVNGFHIYDNDCDRAGIYNNSVIPIGIALYDPYWDIERNGRDPIHLIRYPNQFGEDEFNRFLNGERFVPDDIDYDETLTFEEIDMECIRIMLASMGLPFDDFFVDTFKRCRDGMLNRRDVEINLSKASNIALQEVLKEIQKLV